MCHIKHWKEISSELLNRSNCHVTPTVNSFMRTKWCFEGLLQHLKSVETHFILIFQPYLFIIISHFSIISLYIIIFSLFPIFFISFLFISSKGVFFYLLLKAEVYLYQKFSKEFSKFLKIWYKALMFQKHTWKKKQRKF